MCSQRSSRPTCPLFPSTTGPVQCAEATRRLAELSRFWADERGAEREELNRLVNAAFESLEQLESSIADDPRAGGSDPFVAGTVVTTLRRCLGALVVRGGPTAIKQNESRLLR